MRRSLLVNLHRYVGLVLAPVLAVLGLTGSVIVFDPELDAWLNPGLFALDEPGGPPLPAAELIRRVEADDPRIEAYYLTLSEQPRQASVAYVAPRTDPATGEPFEVDFDEVFIDPISGAVNGRRLWGECCFEAPNFVPFMYKLHNRLLLPIDIGRPLLGVVAVVWLALIVLGGWLTWPASSRSWRHWGRAWSMRRGSSGLQTTLSWHRGGGLWSWLVLAVLALTGVVLGFEAEVRAAVATVSDVATAPAAPDAADGVPVSATLAVAAAREAVAAAGFDQGLTYVSHDGDGGNAAGVYRVRFGSAYAAGLQEVTAYVAAADGRVLGIATARGESVGDLVMNAAQPLHAGRLGGLPGRILVFLGGLAVAGLSVSGTVMWLMRQRRGRRVAA